MKHTFFRTLTTTFAIVALLVSSCAKKPKQDAPAESPVAEKKLRIPQSSPAAMVSQVVGVTKVSVSYSSPAVRGREVFGELEPYDKAWRAGANSPTKITFEDDVMIEGINTPAGEYIIFITPKKEEDWVLHISKGGKSIFGYNVEGKQDYNAVLENDHITLDVAPEMMASSQERLSYHIQVVDETTGKVTMMWHNVAISFYVKTSPENVILSDLQNPEVTKDARAYMQAASYFLKNNDIAHANQYVDMSIGMQAEYFWNTWIKAQVQDVEGKRDMALETLKQAIAYGEAKPDNAYNFFKPQMEEQLKGWME